MPTEPLKLFYCYARADARLLKRLDDHLTILKREGIISEWHDGDISVGQEWEEEIHQHLQSAQIILLLISSSFLASDYCYDIEMQKALEKQEKGNARVIPIILRECDWQIASFRKLQALPSNGKPATMWGNKDAAFADIARGIREVAEKLHGTSSTKGSQTIYHEKKRTKGEQVVKERNMGDGTTEISVPPLKKVIERYRRELAYYQTQANYELGVRAAFQNLLVDAARSVNWTLAPEQTLDNGIRPDGVLRDANNLRRGYWEAKGPKSNLDREIDEKIRKGYPLTNTLFENTKRAVLYQGKRKVLDCDMQQIDDVSDLLQQFLTYTEPHIEKFQTAVLEFKARIPALASNLLHILEDQYKQNRLFITAFNNFASVCRASLDANLNDKEIHEMLVQHLLTERLFRTIFDNPDFVSRNVIAAEIENVVKALTSLAFNRHKFFNELDRYYVAIEGTAKGIESWTERQEFLNTVYEGFFQGFSVKQADTHGIVYTPQEIVDFMCESVNEVLKRDFDKSLETPDVKILDPATGTGNFIVNLIKRVSSRDHLREKYAHDLFCNEIMLLPYYIASLNIEHEYYDKMGEYASFEGICFADTLELAEKLHTYGTTVVQQSRLLMVEANTERVDREKAAEITVVIGNPPYNVGQKSENENNKNRKYPLIDTRIRETYAKASRASNKNPLGDAYVKFFRWATDRLGDRDGIVCLVTNNSFVDQIAFDGMRKYLLQDFTHIYHLDLHGNVRKNPKLSGTTHNVFGIQVGVGITIAIKSTRHSQHKLYYYRVPDFWTRIEKLDFLAKKRSIANIEWLELQPDERNTWITEGLRPEFRTFLSLGSKEARSVHHGTIEETNIRTIFKTYSLGPRTSRDNWMYDFHRDSLTQKVTHFVDSYNSEVDHWRRRGNNSKSVDDFVTYDDTKMKWSRDLKLDLQRERYAEFDDAKIRWSLYRPYCKQLLFFDRILNEEVYQFPRFFPTSATEQENKVICLTDLGSEKPFMVLASNMLVDIHLVGAGCGTQCFPYYTYTEDGNNRRENITNWALKHFCNKYGSQTTKWDIFYYVYAMLHHPQYREHYKNNLQRSLPHIPLLQRSEAFFTYANIGMQLMNIHVNYEEIKEHNLVLLDNNTLPYGESRRVEKMRLSPDKTAVIINKSLTLSSIPQECFQYRLGNRSALEWVIDQYQVTKDKQGNVISDPNRLDDKDYIIRLVKQVVAVSVQTVQLVNQLAQTATVEDWIDGSIEVSEGNQK